MKAFSVPWFTSVLLFSALAGGVAHGQAPSVVLGNLRSPPAFENTSPSGRLHVAATSPDMESPGIYKRLAEPGGCTYVLTDLQTGTVRWSRRRVAGEPTPRRVFVDNDGTVIVWARWLGDIELLVLDGRAGALTRRIHPVRHAPWLWAHGVWQALIDHGSGENVCWMRFVHAGEQRLFVVRHRSGWRVLLDARTAKPVLEGPLLKRALDADDREHALAVLREAVARGPFDPSAQTWRDSLPTETKWAAHVAGQLRERRAIPLLQALERTAVITRLGGRGWEVRERLEANRVHPYACVEYDLRRVVQLSLRRLGVRPAGYPAITLRRAKHSRDAPPLPPVGMPRPDRASRVGHVRAGMLPEEVLAEIGAPDYVTMRGWEYDLDTSPPITLRVRWDPVTVRVKQVKRMWPAVWVMSSARDRELLD